MCKGAISRLLTLFSACAMLASAGAAQDDRLPDRFFLALFLMYTDAGVGDLAEPQAPSGQNPYGYTSEETVALGVNTSYYSPVEELYFGIWPWLVFENGRPIALTFERHLSAEPSFLNAQYGDTISQVREVFAQQSVTVDELSFERAGETLQGHFRSVHGPYYDDPPTTPKFDYGVIDHLVAPIDAAGCFHFEIDQWIEVHGATTPAYYARQNQNVLERDTTYCLRPVRSAALSDGSQAYLLETRVNAFVGLTGAQKMYEATVYMVAVAPPSDDAGGGYIATRGALDFNTTQLVDNINRFAAAIEDTLKEKTVEGKPLSDKTLQPPKFALAAKQIESLNANLADLEAKGIDWHWVKRPTTAGVLRYDALIEATEVYKLTHIDTQARLNDVRQQLEFLRTNFSANVVKSMLKSTINWLNVVPTDPISGLAGYSDIAGALLMPLTLQDWKTTTTSDTAILANQASAIRQFEALEIALEQRLADIVTARRALFERIRERDEARILELDAALR